MDLSRLSASFKSLRYRRQAKALHGIRSVGQLRAIIERERARADRNGHQFSVVLLSSDNPEPDNAQLKYVAQVFAKRIRLTDEAGWFDYKRLGVVLPYTSAASARRLADDICEAIATRISSPKYNIYTYPSNWFSNGKGRSGQLHFADLFPGWSTKRPPWLSKFTTQNDGGKIKLEIEESPENTTSNCQALSNVHDPIFVWPLPAWKRGLDIVGALFGLVVLSPFLLLIALIIKIVSPGPVLFKQPRVGYMGRTFKMWKFRTMNIDADPSNHKQYVAKLINGAAQNDRSSETPMMKLDHDPQIIPFGKIFRKTCIDELPQLVNVLRGEMSLVGPRPPLTYEVEEYLQWNYARFDAVPGMTGLWQVSGKNRLTFFEMMQLDIRYSKSMSLWLDIKILLKTPLAIVSQIRDTLASKKSERLLEEVLENA